METFFLKKVLPAFLLALSLTLHTVPGFAQGGGGCSSIVFSAEHYEPCCYRLHIVSNVSECISNPITLLLNAGSFASWGASTQTGWTGTLISPTELRLTHNSGIIPIGASTPVGFCLPPGVSPTLTVLYDYTCPLGKSCVVEFPLAGCPIVADASISGVKYVDIGCTHLPYTNQPTLPGWTIQLLNSDNVLLDSTVTDANGAYSFTDLPAGQYVCREASKPGWTPGLPASGQHNLTLGQSQMLVRNFGNCPPCSCESIYFSLNPLPGPPDTCCYSLTTQNTAPYCFPFINIHLAAGHFTSSMVLTPGWTITSVDPQNIQLHPPGGTTVPAGFAIPVKFCVTGAAQQNILVSTGWNNGMQSFNCPAEFSFACPQPPVLCCPAGSMQGPQQVVNGDFSAGNTGFTPFFPFFTPGGPTAVGSYSVLQSNQVYAANPQWAATDHTAGTATGKMLIVDGANANGNIVWREMVNVQLGVQYAFCAWANNLVLPTKNLADPVVQLWINGNMVATSTLSEVPDKWILINNLWTANVIGLIPIEIRLGSIQAGGNDFAVDDISFRSCSAEAPCQVSTTVTQIDHCGHVQIHATVTGPQPYTVQWCNGQTGPDLDLHLPCGPYSCAVSVTCANGSTATSTATVVVVDTIPPLAKCLPGIGVVLNANCTATATAASIDNGSSDNCLIQSITLSPNTFTKCGDFPVTLTVTDWCGNTATCTSSVQVHEGIPPQIMCPPNITVLCDLQLSPLFTGQATATDNCTPNPVITYTDVTTGQMPCDGTVVRTWTATDLCENLATCTQIITVHDNVPPSINCPPNTTVNALPGLCYYTGNLPPQLSGSDNCRPVTDFVCSLLTPTQSILITPQTPFPKGTNNITCFARDACGNASPNCNFTLTVVDNQPPTITCPGNVTVQGLLSPPPNQLCKAIVNGLAPTVTDNCPNWTVSYVITGSTTGLGANNASGTNFMQGVSTVTYTVTDCGMNTKTCSFTVTVHCENGQTPLFSCGMAVATYQPKSYNPAEKVLSIRDIRNHCSQPQLLNWLAPEITNANWNYGTLGSIFGIAIDQSNNIYVSATSAYLASWANTQGYGVAGSGGIYKIDAITGNPTPFVTTVAPGAWIANTATLPNDLAGLGNICYDKLHNQFFATNMEDGMIYRINAGGSVLDRYDPFLPDNGMPGIVCQGERLWGIGILGNKLYFSRCNQNLGAGSTANEIYSLTLTGTGMFPSAGTHILEKTLPPLAGHTKSNPVSDIEFSSSGKMILAERSENGACFPVVDAHNSRVLEYTGAPGALSAVPKQFYIGNFGDNTNAAGGVDYGYKCFNPASMPLGACDEMVWASGDALKYTTQEIPPGSPNAFIYGLAGIPASGNASPAVSNTPPFSPLNSWYMDNDMLIGDVPKYHQGDVDIIHCGCLAAPSFCDSISVTSMPFNGPQDTCCFKLTLHNQKPNFFTGIQLCASNGVSISNVTVLNGCNLQSYGATQATVVPAGGVPNTFPVGDKDFIRFCLSNYQVVPSQQIIVKYYGPDFKVVCSDTLTFNCTQKPKCMKVTSTVECGPAGSGTYIMNFCVMSNQFIGYNVNSIQLNPPAGVTFTPSIFATNNIPPGGMQCGFVTTISGNVVDGEKICFSVTAHQGNILAVPPPVNETPCCTDTVMQACVTLPACVCNHLTATPLSVMSPDGKCCWKINLTNSYSNTYFTGVELDIKTLGVVFSAITNPPGSGWNLNQPSTDVAIFNKINPGGTTIGTSAMLPVFCLSGIASALQVPQVVVLKWLGPNHQVVCTDTLKFYCPPPDSSDCATLIYPQIVCDPTTPGVYSFSFQVYNNSGFTINQVNLNNITGGTIIPSQFSLNTPVLNLGTSVVLNAQIFGALPGQMVYFYLTVHDVGLNGNELNCCTHSQRYCFTMPPCPTECICGPFDILYSVSHGPLLIKHCGDTLVVPSSPNLPIGFLTSFQCYGTNCPPATVDWKLTGPIGFVTQMMNGVPATPGFTIPVTNSTFTIAGVYTLTMTGHCGANLCPCVIYFKSPGTDTCECKGFSKLSFYNSSWLGVAVPASCGESSTLPCLKPGQNPLFYFHGNLNCSAKECLTDSVQWTIVQMPAGNTVASGATFLNPLNPSSSSGHFDVVLKPSWFINGGQYMLTVTGHCGTQVCTCKVNFNFQVCPCPCDQLEEDVAQGFKVLGINPGGCQKTLMPIALCAGDVVTWTVNGFTYPVTTTGNGVKIINFNGSGSYTVCMNVLRTGQNGLTCTFIKCQTVIVVGCPGGVNPNFCSSSNLVNGDFTAPGLVPGHLGNGAILPGWTLFPNPGAGFVFVDSSGASDGGHVILNGGQHHFAGIYQQVDLSTAASDSFVIIQYFVRNYSGHNLPGGTVLEFRLQKEPFVGSLPSQILKTEPVDHDSSAWQKHSITVKPMSSLGDMHFLVICLQSQDSSIRSVVGIDDIEICASETSGTGEPEQLRHFRIFPNPNPGTFNVELPVPAGREMTFRITDLTGRGMLTRQTDPGSQRQTVDAGNLPPGLYFLQVVAGGRVLAVEKFVKQ